MLALDTNVIVRYLMNDSPEQAATARKIIDNQKVFVCTTVVLETEWVLRSAYKLPQDEIARALTDFAGLPTMVFEDLNAVADALDLAKDGMELADALHLVKSHECEAFVTFDKRLARKSAKLDFSRVQLL